MTESALDDGRLADDRNLQDRRLGPESGRFIAERAMVVRKLLASGLQIRSLLLTASRLATLEATLVACEETVPVFLVPQTVMDGIAGSTCIAAVSPSPAARPRLAPMQSGCRRVRLWATDPSREGEVAGLFRVETQELFCNPSPGTGHPRGGGAPPPDDYAFRFSARSGGGQVTLATGQTDTLTVITTSGQKPHLTVHNLRSYQSPLCDDHGNWAW